MCHDSFEILPVVSVVAIRREYFTSSFLGVSLLLYMGGCLPIDILTSGREEDDMATTAREVNEWTVPTSLALDKLQDCKY